MYCVNVIINVEIEKDKINKRVAAATKPLILSCKSILFQMVKVMLPILVGTIGDFYHIM